MKPYIFHGETKTGFIKLFSDDKKYYDYFGNEFFGVVRTDYIYGAPQGNQWLPSYSSNNDFEFKYFELEKLNNMLDAALSI